ncbi:antA/AntB antirepressor family protein [Marinomonas flavescens]
MRVAGLLSLTGSALNKLGRDFSNWIKARINRYGFIEGEDFMCVEI